MNGHGKSGSPVVPAMPLNRAAGAAAEAAEERGLAEGNADGRHAPDTGPGQACQAGWTACVKWHDVIGTRGSLRCCTMSAWTGW
jgi:hypothetical protein